MKILKFDEESSELLLMAVGFVITSIGVLTLIDEYVGAGVSILTLGLFIFSVGINEDAKRLK